MKLVCIGDSLTYGYGIKRSEVWTKLVEKEYDFRVINKGINGDSTTGMVSRFHRDVIENKPSHVIIMGGANDLIMDVPLGVIKSNISTMVHQARSKNIVPIIGTQPLSYWEEANNYWHNITNFKRLNENLLEIRMWIFKFAKIFDVQIIDFCGNLTSYTTDRNISDIYLDGLHLTPKGNEIMLGIINSSKALNDKVYN